MSAADYTTAQLTFDPSQTSCRATVLLNENSCFVRIRISQFDNNYRHTKHVSSLFCDASYESCYCSFSTFLVTELIFITYS